MKTFSVAVAVAVVLAIICIQESSAFTFTGVQELEELMSNDNPVAEHEETAVDSWMMPYNFRQKHQSGPAAKKCRLCCNCCSGMRGCGVCCKF
ncbi:hepcidin-like [Lates calcarifer]|uniref:Hepcidin-like n=1 Tax=Lates calcarifer TaxID=8187 RepID=A0A4W6EA38_LATCA|nr:hepcidin-like [Lates calcarifer]